MKKVVKGFILIILLAGIVVGRFYYSVYASEYQYGINNVTDKNSEEYNTIKVGTYNIKSMNYSRESLDDFNNDINGLDLDIICLQEVDLNAYRSGNYDMLKEMAKANDYPYYHFYQTMWIIDGYYGIGILSKYPIVEVSSQLLPNSLLKEPRVLTKTIINFNNQEIDIYNTHLTYENNRIRVDQMNFVREQVNFDNYSILAGDFNSFGMNNDFNIEGIESINSDKSYMTFRNFGAPDDIYYSKHFELNKRGLVNSSFSDHNLLYGEFEITNQ